MSNITAIAPEFVSEGELVCAFIPEDGLWYRALVQSVTASTGGPEGEGGQSDVIRLYFVDFGNTETVKTEHIRPFTRDFLDVPVVCVKVHGGGGVLGAREEVCEESSLTFGSFERRGEVWGG